MGGGFSISECALKSGKWQKVLYNDINPLIVNLIKDAISGRFNFKVFRPDFITRDKFNELKEKDGYVKYIWSFGNNGKAYLFGKDIEHFKHIAHDYVCFGKRDVELYKLLPLLDKKVSSKIINERRKQFCAYAKEQSKYNPRLQGLQQLERLQQLEQLQRLERLQQLEICCDTYENYKYKEGDIVYCDIPYEKTASYSGGFDHKRFYEWVDKQPFTIYFSSYIILNCKYKVVWAKGKIPLLNSKTRLTKIATEVIYRSK